jgi:hypothetical protein
MFSIRIVTWGTAAATATQLLVVRVQRTTHVGPRRATHDGAATRITQPPPVCLLCALLCCAVLCCAVLCSAGAGAGASASASAGAARACVVASVRQREATSKARTWHLAGASKTHSLRAAGAGAGQARARWGVGITQTPKGWTHLAGLPAHVCAVKVDDVGGVKLAAQNPPAEWHAGSGIIYLS